MPSDSPSTCSDRPLTVSGNDSRDISAALFAALFQALRHCPPSRRSAVLDALESRLGEVVDDLSAKLESLLAPGTPERDRIQGLWLLYLSLVSQSQGDVQMWIGPDLFSDDAESHLRLHLPEGGASAFRPRLPEELEILAQTVNNAARVTLNRPGPGQLVVVLRDATSPT
ncbi:hypothetical protein [Desulfonatronum sp. SC1]|uniref:hypothetical protein n=1 Tax=Desulfonatronum sp. SC1 TaxID=2109626 RepID=UPI0011B1D0E1|nr:hypothetical protein [Desulfonatronum sp. SC1]